MATVFGTDAHFSVDVTEIALGDLGYDVFEMAFKSPTGVYLLGGRRTVVGLRVLEAVQLLLPRETVNVSSLSLHLSLMPLLKWSLTANWSHVIDYLVWNMNEDANSFDELAFVSGAETPSFLLDANLTSFLDALVPSHSESNKVRDLLARYAVPTLRAIHADAALSTPRPALSGDPLNSRFTWAAEFAQWTVGTRFDNPIMGVNRVHAYVCAGYSPAEARQVEFTPDLRPSDDALRTLAALRGC